MRTNNGIAYFGGGTIKDRINNARMLDIMSIQLKISEIDSLADFDGYTGELVCYLDDLRWDKEYFLELEKKVGMLKSKGLTGVIVDVSLDLQVYKKLAHEEKINKIGEISNYLSQFVNSGIKVSILDSGNGIFLGVPVVSKLREMNMALSENIGYAINVNDVSKMIAQVDELGSRNIKAINIIPVMNGEGIDYPRTRVILGEVYARFARDGVMPSTYSVANSDLNRVSELIYLSNNEMSAVVSKMDKEQEQQARGNARTRSNGKTVGFSQQSARLGSVGFVNCIQMFLTLCVIGLVGVLIALALVLI